MWPECTWTNESNLGERVKAEVESSGNGRNGGRCRRVNGKVGDEQKGACGVVAGREAEKVLQDNP